MEVDVEVDAELVQRRLDLGEHQVDAAGAEDLLRGLLGQRAGIGLAGRGDVREHPGRDLVDVGAAVAPLGKSAPLGPRQQRPGEPVDLRAVVVEVVLAGHLRAGRLEDAGEAVADGRPAGPAEMDRAGRVRGDELEVDPVAETDLAAPVSRAGFDDGARQLAGRGGVEHDVEKPGAGDVHALDPRQLGETGRDQRGDLPGRPAGLLRQLERDVGRPVAVLALPRALHADLVGHGDVEVTGVDGGLQARPDGRGEFSGGHSTRLAAGPRRRPSSSSSTVICREASNPPVSMIVSTAMRTAKGRVHAPVVWRRMPTVIGPNPAIR